MQKWHLFDFSIFIFERCLISDADHESADGIAYFLRTYVYPPEYLCIKFQEMVKISHYCKNDLSYLSLWDHTQKKKKLTLFTETRISKIKKCIIATKNYMKGAIFYWKDKLSEKL